MVQREGKTAAEIVKNNAMTRSETSGSLSARKAEENYNFEVARKEDREVLFNFLNDHFRVMEPLNRASAMTTQQIAPCLNDVLDRCLQQPWSFVVRPKDNPNEIAGAAFSYLWSKPTPNVPVPVVDAFPFEKGDQRVETIGKILDSLHVKLWGNDKIIQHCPDIYAKHVLHLEIASVSSKHVRRGIASALMNRIEDPELLTKMGANGVAAEASSFANQMLLMRRGYLTLAEEKLSNWKDSSDKQLLVCDDGTDRVRLMYKHFVNLWDLKA